MILKKRNRPGSVVVLVAVSLTLVLGFAALSIEGGLVQHNRRLAQSTADAAALAAAGELYANFPTLKGEDSGTGKTKALAVADANGLPENGPISKVTVNIPPQSGAFSGVKGYAEVLIEVYQSRGFSRIWGTDKVTIKARAVARGLWEPFRNGILVLDPAKPASLSAGGGGRMEVVGADVIVNSKAPDAAVANGGGTVIAPNFYITGVPGTSTPGGGSFEGNIVNDQPPTPDPLAYLPEPDPSKMTERSKNPSNYAGNRTVNIQPGVYKGGIKVSGQVTLKMAPGIYYMDSGGFEFTGQGNLEAEGVMVFTSPKVNSDTINISGIGQIKFTPPTSGIYTGIALWQERASTNTVTLSGNGTSQLYGTVYAQKGLLSVTGNGEQDVIGSQYISHNVVLGGNGNFNISWNHDQTARSRVITLVE